jgi:(p)ppGpp synthase/HD superfamily hydrolase
MTNPTTEILWRALAAAESAHRGQRRKVVPVPYLVHLLGVVHKLLSYGFPEHPHCVAGLLHDTVEHGRMTREVILREFGTDVTALVDGLSPAMDGGAWHDRKAETIQRLRSAPEDVVTLACADKFDNLLSTRDDFQRFGAAAWVRLGRPREAQEWYFRSLAAVFNERAASHSAPAMLLDFAAEVERVFGEVT